MALGAKYVAVNAASKALAVAVQDLLDESAAAGTHVLFVPMPSGFNHTALNSGDFPAGSMPGDGSAANITRVVYPKTVASSTGAMIYDFPGVDIGRLPIFWKVTDSSYLLSDA